MTRAEKRQQLVDQLAAHNGDIQALAAALGSTYKSVCMRLYRAGVTKNALALMRQGIPLATRLHTIDPTTQTITLPVADYALLKEAASRSAERLWDELQTANRIIDTLTRELERIGRKEAA